MSFAVTPAFCALHLREAVTEADTACTTERPIGSRSRGLPDGWKPTSSCPTSDPIPIWHVTRVNEPVLPSHRFERTNQGPFGNDTLATVSSVLLPVRLAGPTSCAATIRGMPVP